MLQGLHWPPVHQHINFKLICTTYKIIYSSAPTYLNELLSIYAPPRNFRSISTGGVRLNQPIQCNKLKCNEQAFSVSAPRLRSSLSLKLCLIRSYNRFKFNLRIHLFNEYYLA